jgi:hypothetical protein
MIKRIERGELARGMHNLDVFLNEQARPNAGARS